MLRNRKNRITTELLIELPAHRAKNTNEQQHKTNKT